jgi:hypothetical protein
MSRLQLITDGHGPLQRVFLRIIRAIIGYVPEPILVMSYRRGLFGRYFAPVLPRAMRKSTHWTPAECEIMAAVVAQHSECEY